MPPSPVRVQPDHDRQPYTVPPGLVPAMYAAFVRQALREHRIHATSAHTWLRELIEEHQTLETLQSLVPVDLEGDQEPTAEELYDRIYGPDSLRKGRRV